MSYINFHTHSCYSTKDGISTPLELAKKNIEMGNDAFVITDHGVLGSFIDAYQVAKELEIQFIPGCEIYLIPDAEYWDWNVKHNDDIETAEVTARYHHLTLIAKNQVGLHSLIKIHNRHVEHYGKPCISKDVLFNNSDGLIVLSGCVTGEPSFYIQNRMPDKAKAAMQAMKDHFGDDYYCELQYHGLKDTKISEEEIYNQLVRIARDLNIEMVPTTDSHFTYREERKYHDIYKAIYKERYEYDFTKKAFTEAFDGDWYYVLNEEEIVDCISNIPELTPEEVKHAVENSMVIRSKCEVTEFPKAKPLENKSKELRRLAEIGFNERRKGTPMEEESRERLEYELETIEGMGFTEYFINVWQIVDRAAKLNILVGPGRGCFLPGNKVVTSEGYKNIEDIKIGDEVVTRSGEFKPVVDSYEYDVEEECIELELSNGGKITCTPDHKFLLNGEWVEAQELSIGDKLTRPLNN